MGIDPSPSGWDTYTPCFPQRSSRWRRDCHRLHGITQSGAGGSSRFYPSVKLTSSAEPSALDRNWSHQTLSAAAAFPWQPPTHGRFSHL